MSATHAITSGWPNAPTGRSPGLASFGWPWGDALDILGQAAPTARLVALETSITRSADFAPGKGVHHRMSPQNLPALAELVTDVPARHRTRAAFDQLTTAI